MSIFNDISKSSSLQPLDQSEEDISIMILDGSINYATNPCQLKKDLDKLKISNLIN